MRVQKNDKEAQYDVRFFGGYHQRALIDKQNIRPITVNVHSLQVLQNYFRFYQFLDLTKFFFSFRLKGHPSGTKPPKNSRNIKNSLRKLSSLYLIS